MTTIEQQIQEAVDREPKTTVEEFIFNTELRYLLQAQEIIDNNLKWHSSKGEQGKYYTKEFLDRAIQELEEGKETLREYKLRQLGL